MLLGAFVDDAHYLFVVREPSEIDIRVGKRKSQIGHYRQLGITA